MSVSRIYFCGSIRGGRDDRHIYVKLIDQLKKFGTVLTEHIGSDNATDPPKELPTDKGIHDRDMEWLISSDVIVAEVTTPSLGVGYEIGRAVALNKPILCLFRPNSSNRLSAMIQGAEGKRFEVFQYSTIDDAENRIAKFFDTHQNAM